MKVLTSVRVAVAARSEVARGGLARMLEEAPNVEEYEVFDAEEFTAAAPEDAIQLLILSCDVLVLWCTNGSGLGGDEWAAELATVTRKNGIRVALVLPGDEVRRAASGGGVPCDGILDQNALTAVDLSQALSELSRGERPVTKTAERGAAPVRGREAAPRAASPIGSLTERERQVLELLVDGLSNKQIGLALAMSEHTAKRVVAIVLSKLDCPNRTHAVAVALREGLVPTG